MTKEDTAPDGAESETLEGRLRRLEEIMGQLESDQVELERALALFEEGVGLVRASEGILSRTELRVEELLASGRTAPLDTGGDGDDAGSAGGAPADRSGRTAAEEDADDGEDGDA